MLLKDWLDQKEMTAREFATKIGVHESTLSRCMTLQQRPSLPLVIAIDKETNGEVGLHDWQTKRVPKTGRVRRSRAASYG